MSEPTPDLSERLRVLDANPLIRDRRNGLEGITWDDEQGFCRVCDEPDWGPFDPDRPQHTDGCWVPLVADVLAAVRSGDLQPVAPLRERVDRWLARIAEEDRKQTFRLPTSAREVLHDIRSLLAALDRRPQPEGETS